jgi:hypothetical protein
MLEVRNLRKRYSGIPAVDGVTFVARTGEVTARDYQRAIRWPWLTLGVAPVLISMACVIFFLRLLHEAAELEGRLLCVRTTNRSKTWAPPLLTYRALLVFGQLAIVSVLRYTATGGCHVEIAISIRVR